jgi:hypothetical protein
LWVKSCPDGLEKQLPLSLSQRTSGRQRFVSAAGRSAQYVAKGRTRHFDRVPVDGEAPERRAWGQRRYRTGIEKVCFAPILLQKSFWGDERKFLEPLMRFTRGDVRDYIVSSKIDHGSPSWR